MPSLPATGDGSVRPFAENPGADSGDGERSAGESGRWFRPAKAKTGYLEIPADGPDLASPSGAPGLVPPPGGGTPGATADERPERPEQREAAVTPRISRRTVLQASLIGGAGVAALPLLALVGDITRTRNQPTGLVFSMNTNWLFGGPYMAGSESSFYDDSGFALVTVPHTVTQLSWQNWDFPAWQQVWIYRRHFSGGRLLDSYRPGNRILVDFDGIMVNASVVINDQVVGTHRGGYLPFSAELTGKVTGGDNLLAIIVDSRCLPVPPIGVGRGPRSVDFFQPGGIYRDVRLRVLPQVFLSGLFAQPAGVLSPQPRVDVDQLYPYAGMAMGARVQRKDAEILKDEFNCTMVRCSHYPQSPDFLDACDELGLLVWEEAPGWHNVSLNPAWQGLVVQDVRDMVIRDRSRPSVVIWGTRLNETRDFPMLWAATRQAARELDSSRPSSGAMAFHEDGTWDEDVFAYNDYGTRDKTGNIALKPPFPGLPYLVTEAVGVEAAKPQHFAWTDPPAWLARQAALHGQAQSQARSNPGYAGLLAWAGFDYASMLGPGPYDIKWAGVADGFRVPKPGAAIYQTQGDPAVRPVIIPVFFWEPGGAVPAPNPTAMIASNCDQLEVFIGGTHVASAQPASGSPLYRGLIHPPFLEWI